MVTFNYDWSTKQWLALVLVINVVLNLIYFACFLQINLTGLLLWNPCWLVELLAALALIKKNYLLKTVAAFLLLVIGFTGLFILDWTGVLLKGQFDHLLMIGVAIYFVEFELVSKRAIVGGIYLSIISALILSQVWAF